MLLLTFFTLLSFLLLFLLDRGVGADIVLLADFTSPTAVNSYLGVNFLVEAIAFEVSRQLGVFPQQRLSRMDHYLSELHLY